MVCMDGQGLMSSSRRYNLSTEAEVEQFSSDTKLGPDTKGGVSEAPQKLCMHPRLDLHTTPTQKKDLNGSNIKQVLQHNAREVARAQSYLPHHKPTT